MDELQDDVEELAGHFVVRVRELPDYSAESVTDEELRRTAVDSLGLLIACMHDGVASPMLISFASKLGARRARHGMPKESLTSAVRLDFGIIWSHLLEICGVEDAPLLASRAEPVWAVIDHYAGQIHAGYMDERIQMAQEESNFRAEFISLLFTPAGKSAETLNQIAAALKVDLAGSFAIAAATGSAAGQLRALAGQGLRSKGLFLHQSDGMTFLFWQTEQGRERALRSYQRPEIDSIPCGLVPVVSSLDSLPSAAMTAAALARLTTVKDSAPLTARRGWTRMARDVMRKAGIDVAGELDRSLAVLRADERDRLLETIQRYLVTGSIAKTADEMFCHRNTILNRINRFRDLSGIDVTVPAQAAPLAVLWL